MRVQPCLCLQVPSRWAELSFCLATLLSEWRQGPSLRGEGGRPAVCSCAEPPGDGGTQEAGPSGCRRAVDAAAEQRGALPARLPPLPLVLGLPACPGAPCSGGPGSRRLHAGGSWER